jgi:RHS repeat-associated protein
MLGETQKQFSLTRAALSTDRRAKSKFLSVLHHRTGVPAPISTLAVLLAAGLPYLGLAQNPQNMEVFCPAVARLGDIVHVTVSMSGGSEVSWWSTKNLGWEYGWWDHCRWDKGDSCLNGTNKWCPGDWGHECRYVGVGEWSMDFRGPPHDFFRVTGCDEAVLIGYYLDANHGGTYHTRPYTIRILNAPSVSVALKPGNLICLGRPVTFAAEVTCGRSAHVIWDFADGQTAQGLTVSHTYAHPGNYLVKFMAVNANGANVDNEVLVEVTDWCGSLAGTVTNAISGEPIQDALVVATPTGGWGPPHRGGEISVRTGPDGRYETAISSSRNGYDVLITHPLYQAATGTVEVLNTLPAVFDAGLWPRSSADTRDTASLLGEHHSDPPIADPVTPAIGNYLCRERLFRMPGVGPDLDFVLYYNSLAPDADSPVGLGWTHSYGATVSRTGPEIVIRWGDGHVERFRDQGNGLFSPTNCNSAYTLSAETGGILRATLRGGTTYRFDAAGRLVAVSDRFSNTVALAHGALLERIADTAGREIVFTYTNGRVHSIATPLTAGPSAVFSYDTEGRLVTLQDARGIPWRFDYDAQHRLVTRWDGNGHRMLNLAYDGNGRVTNLVDAAGHSTQFDYTPFGSGQRTSIRAAGSPPAVLTYDRGYNLLAITDTAGHTSSFDWDAAGRLLKVVDKLGQVTALMRDEAGNVLSVSNAVGVSLSLSYNALNAVTQLVDAAGSSAAVLYDTAGRRTSFSDFQGNWTALANDAQGRPLRMIDRSGATNEYEYGPDGLLAAAHNALGQVWRWDYDAAGRATNLTLPGGGRFAFAYDPRGNLLEQIEPGGVRTTYAYDANNNLIRTVFEPLGATNNFGYDALNRLVAMTNAAGAVLSYEYDARGNLAAFTDPDGVTQRFEYDARNLVTSLTDGAGSRLAYAYDADGRRVAATDALGGRWTLVYGTGESPVAIEDPTGGRLDLQSDVSGRVISRRDADGVILDLHYDRNGRPLADVLPGQPASEYGHDAEDRLTRWRDAHGDERTFAYDAAGRLVKATADGAARTFAYDADDQVTQVVNRAGGIGRYTYDAAGRLLTAALPDGQCVTNGYDGAGRLVAVDGPNSSLRFSYDIMGNTILATNLNGLCMAFEYTRGGRLARMIYPGDRAVTYAYDAAGRLHIVRDWVGHITTWHYDDAGRLVAVDLPNGTRTEYGRDTMGRLSRLAHLGTNGVVLAEASYAYTPGGRLDSVRRAGAGAAPLAGHDATRTYASGNRLLKEVSAAGTNTFQFDLEGRLAMASNETAVTSYAYDARDRLLAVTNATGTTTYSYDAQGRRATKTFNGQMRRYLAFGSRLFGEADATNGMQRIYVHGAGVAYSLDASGAMRMYHADERRSVVAITDGDGGLLATYAYGPFGETVAAAGPADNALKFLGAVGVLTDENGLLHMPVRDYNPVIRSFLTQEPLGLDNLHAYGEGDPANGIDPTGLETKSYADFLIMATGAYDMMSDGDADYDGGRGTPAPYLGSRQNIAEVRVDDQTETAVLEPRKGAHEASDLLKSASIPDHTDRMVPVDPKAEKAKYNYQLKNIDLTSFEWKAYKRVRVAETSRRADRGVAEVGVRTARIVLSDDPTARAANATEAAGDPGVWHGKRDTAYSAAAIILPLDASLPPHTGLLGPSLRRHLAWIDQDSSDEHPAGRMHRLRRDFPELFSTGLGPKSEMQERSAQ